MAATYPAEIIGLKDSLGKIKPGYQADLVVLSPDFKVNKVMRSGVWA